MEDLKKAVLDYMGSCASCTVATAGPDGEPDASTVYFSVSGLDIYFNTAKNSEKIKNIKANPRVAIVMQKNPAPKTDREISGIQYRGTAKIMTAKEHDGVPGPVMARHNVFNSIKPGNSVIVRVTPVEIYLIDYTKGFRHRDRLKV